MKKKLSSLVAAVATFSTIYAQIGVNIASPNATFDITPKTTGSQPEGILIPRLTGDQIKSMEAQLGINQNSMMIYATSAATVLSLSTIDLTSPGFYYYNSGLTKWVAVNNGGVAAKIPISGLIDGTAVNALDSKNFAQTWNWTTASTQTPLTLRANALTTGTLLDIATASTALNSTNGLVRIINNAAPSTTTGIFARLQPNSTSGSGISLLNNGNSGFGILLPTAKIHASESGTTNQPAAILSQTSSAADAGSITGTGSKGMYIDMGAATLDRALAINQNGVAANSRGLNITMASANNAFAGFINHTGTGEGFRIQNNNAANNSDGILIIHDGNSTGNGIRIQMEATGNTGNGVNVLESGAATSIYATSSITGSVDPTTAVSTKRAGVWADRTIGSAAGNNAGSGYSGPASTATTSAHTSLYGVMGNATTSSTTDSYIFGVIGEVLSSGGAAAVDRSGGVLGNGQVSGTFGILGYKTSGSASVGVYGNAAMATGTGKSATGTTATGFGVMGVGDLMGAAFKGDVYGMNVSGSRYGMYIDGAAYTNNVIANVSNTESMERIATYVPTSTTVDVYTRGTATIDANGRVDVRFDKNFSNLAAENSVVVTITPIGKSSQIYLEKEPTASGFSAKTDDNNLVKFSYIAVGTRRGFENVSVPKEILAGDYDEKMSKVLHNEGDINSEGKPVHWNGNELKFEESENLKSNTKLDILHKAAKKTE
ncbi:hypothetical protein [Chryseobacterium shigense]|uniref:Uncharacterized protein n=1 Tax=Chryseobacterium shigense TaxID=297244 RepID=A0A841NKN6_9FLAO|nr:hypothetical protein [Chryseobacterium shigense]MBB6371345.1 hypothetical protein [Chryseobacterium shigense]